MIARTVAIVAALVPSIALAQPRSPSAFVADSIRDALKEQGTAPQMKSIDRNQAELKTIVTRHLNASLLKRAEGISGRDFQFQFTPDRKESVGVLILRFPNGADATQGANLVMSQQYFRNSEILIPFRTVALGKLLVVVYSENGGDRRIVDALDKLPAAFKEASRADPAPWGSQ